MAKKKAIFEDELITKYKHGKEVFLALEHHRKSNRWSLRNLGDEVCQRLDHLEPKVVEEALQVYLAIKDRKVPHINYFVAIAERMSSKPKEEVSSNTEILWGRMI